MEYFEILDAIKSAILSQSGVSKRVSGPSLIMNISGKPLSLTKVIKLARLNMLSRSQGRFLPAQQALWSNDDIALHISENFSLDLIMFTLLYVLLVAIQAWTM